jgi:thiol reductant ABC exporter CydD subunit
MTEPRGGRAGGPVRLLTRVIRETPGIRAWVLGLVALESFAALSLVGWSAALGALVASLHPGPAPTLLPLWIRAGAAALVVESLATGGSRWVAAELGWRMRQHWRRRLIEHILQMGPATVDRREAGTLAAVATESVEALAGMVTGVLPRLVTAAILPSVIVAAAFVWFWPAGAILAVTLPLVPALMVLTGEAARRAGDRQWAELRTLEAHFLDVVEGVVTLTLFNRGTHQLAVIQRLSDRYRDRVSATVRTALLSSLVLELFAAIAVALVAVAVGLAVMAGRLGYGPALTVLILTPFAYGPLRQLGKGFHQALAGFEAARTLLERVDSAPPVTVRGTLVPGPLATAPTIRVASLSAGYPTSGPVFTDLDWTIERGGHWVVVGANGTGKTTLLSCLLGYLAPLAGEIRIDDWPLSALDPGWWRAQVGYVPETPYLLPGTVRENLSMARPGATDAEIWTALEAAQAAAFVADLPEGLETRVGDKGLGLSAGERQRLGIARLLLRGAPVAFLDEPTRHLDVFTGRRLMSALERFLEGRTAVVVTHQVLGVPAGSRVLDLGGWRHRVREPLVP